jgi:hypothetical protein
LVIKKANHKFGARLQTIETRPVDMENLLQSRKLASLSPQKITLLGPMRQNSKKLKTINNANLTMLNRLQSVRSHYNLKHDSAQQAKLFNK